MNKIKMVGLDLDGTLLRDDKSISSRSREAIAEAIRQGVTVLVSTGRPLTGIPEELKHFPGMRYLLASNGARVVDLWEGKTLYESLISMETAGKILDVFDRYDTMEEVFFDGIGYINETMYSQIGRYLENPGMAGYVEATRRPVGDIRIKMREMNRPLDKVQATFRELDEKRSAQEDLKQIDGIEVTGALMNNIEVNNGGVNKGAGLLRLGEMLGITREEIMACGDGMNDLKMLEEVGFAVAMENGTAEIKNAADYITAGNNEDGVAKAIEKFVLN